MKFMINIGKLVFNFMKDVVFSGLDTARVILWDPNIVNSGTTRISYGELNPKAASLLGALISLTPGTTVIAMDLQCREFLIHLLDLRRRGATVATIQRHFMAPLLELQGKRA